MMNKNQDVVLVPVQARSRERYDKILDASELLILELGLSETSVHLIAKRAGVSRASVYQYFTSKEFIIDSLAKKHFESVFTLYEKRIRTTKITKWQDLAEILVQVSYEFYIQQPIREKIFLSLDSSISVRKTAAERLTVFSNWFIQYFDQYFELPENVQLNEKIALCININDAAYLRSLSLYGQLTPAYRDEAIFAVKGYLTHYLGDVLPLKTIK